MPCKLCLTRKKDWVGDDPVCAFGGDGREAVFSKGNFRCATLTKLRDAAEAMDGVQFTEYNQQCTGVLRGYDQSAAMFNLSSDGCFLVLGWYKNRGRTEAAFILDEFTMRPATLADCEDAFLAVKSQLGL